MAGNAAKRKGTRNEHRSMAVLEASGYRCVRSGGSLGVFDLVGFCAVSIVLVQVKTNAWPGLLEIEAMREFQVPYGVHKLIHRWDDRSHLPMIREVAER